MAVCVGIAIAVAEAIRITVSIAKTVGIGVAIAVTAATIGAGPSILPVAYGMVVITGIIACASNAHWITWVGHGGRIG